MQKDTPESKLAEERASEDRQTLPPNVIRIECADGCEDYIEIVFDKPVEEIRKEIEEEERRKQRSLWGRIKRFFQRGER
ncbi:hypothetical protein [Helicobacter salomonis]|uniref:hypothetical protein n=1 Tax=Helicobacter salomonis TaxID=56878 RepID=UPI0013158134|nr:hypothetical protein [Helicobacter salomonis]